MKEFFENLLRFLHGVTSAVSWLWSMLGMLLFMIAGTCLLGWISDRVTSAFRRRWEERQRQRKLRVNPKANALDQLRRLNDEEKLLRARTETKLAEFAAKRTDLELFIGAGHYRVPDTQIASTSSAQTESDDSRSGDTPRQAELRAEGQLGPSSKLCG